MRIPTVLHEQNAVLGRVNRLLAGEVDAIATAYDEVERLKPRYQRQGPSGRQSGARGGARAAATMPFPPFDEDGAFKILVTGGSQGATVLGEVVPEGARPAASHRSAAGCRSPSNAAPTISSAVRARYAELGIPAELADLYRGHARAARRGASGHRPRRRLDHRRADRRRPARRSWCRCRSRPTITRPPMRAKWPRPAARG